MNSLSVTQLLPGDSAAVLGRGRALLPVALPLERTGDGTRSPVGCEIEGEEQIGVGVLDAHASWPQAHVDLAALVYVAGVAVRVRESEEHATDPFAEATQRETEPAFHTGSHDLGQLNVPPSNVNLHLVLCRANQGTSPACSLGHPVFTPQFF